MLCFSHCPKITVEPVLLLYMFATFMQYVAFQDLIYQKVCALQFSSSDVCQNLYAPENKNSLSFVQKEASLWIMMSSVCLSLPSILSSNFLGSWGDTFGWKVSLSIPPLGGVLSTAIYVWISFTGLQAPIWPLLLASAISGAFGGFASCIMGVMSYVSRISNSEDRTVRIALLEAMTFLGGTAGPFAGGVLLAAFGNGSVFLLIGTCHILILLYVFLCLSEVIPENRSSERKKYCSFSHLSEAIKVCFKRREGSRRQAIIAFMISCFIIMIATAGELDVSYLYVKDLPLKWNYEMYSYYFGLKHALSSLVLIGGPRLWPIMGFELSDYTVCLIGILSKIAGYLMLSFSSTTLLMFLVPVVSMMNVFCIPSLRSLLSKQVDPHELGKLFACVASVENICTLFGSLVFNSLYPTMRHVYRGLIFHFAAAINIIPLIIMSYTILQDHHVYVPLNNP